MDPFEMNYDEIQGAVKHEVGLIQGKRAKRQSKQVNKASSSDDESENCYHASAHNGTGDDVTKVLKMECCVFKDDIPSVKSPKHEEDSVKLEMDLERMLVAYCFQYDIPYVPKIPAAKKKAGGFHEQHHGKQSYGDPRKSKKENLNYTASNPAMFIPLPSGIGKMPTSSGGGGGGKRPPRPHNVKKIPADAKSQTDTTSESGGVGHRKSARSIKNKKRSPAESLSTVSSLATATVAAVSSVAAFDRGPKPLDTSSSSSAVNFNPKPQVRLLEDNPHELQKRHTSERESTRQNEHKHHKIKISGNQTIKPSLISTFGDISQSLERDDEWLDYTTSEDEIHDEDAEETEGNRPPEERERPVDPDLQSFVNATKALDRVTSLLGLYPYQKAVRGNKCIQVKWNPRSGEFMGMCMHAFLFFLVTVSAFMSMGYITYDIVKPVTSTQQVLQIEFANHVTECLFIVFITLFLSVWSVSAVMELGVHYAEFMTRVNFAICLLKYDVTDGVHSMIVKSLSLTGSVIVFAVLLFFGGRFKTPAFREACGFIGFAVIRPLDFKIRESIYFPLVELLGLVIALHSVLCFNVVVLQFMVYAKSLENMARKFNLRLVYRLGKVYEGSPHERKKHVIKYIPFNKLYAEHRIVTSLFQHFGQVNSIILSCFLLVMALEVMLLMWMFFEVFRHSKGVDEHDSSNILRKVGTVTLAVPLRLTEFETEVVIKAVVLFDLTVIGFIKFGGAMHNAADTLHIGMEYIRRHGLMLCRSSKERRFILTMISSYAPKAPYWIGKSFRFNRSSIIGFLAFLVSASMVFASFHPARTASQQLQECDESGGCTVYKFPKTGLDRVYAAVPPPPSGKPPPPSNWEPGFPVTTNKPVGLKNPLSSFIYLKSLCTSGGNYPYDLYEHSASCPSKWSLPSQPAVIFTPYLYRQLEFTDSTATGRHHYFAQVRLQFAQYSLDSQECADLREKPPEQIAFPVGRTSACVSDTFPCHYFPFQSAFENSPTGSEVVNCFNRPVSRKEMDDCRNLKISTTDSAGKRIEAQPRIVYTGRVPGVTDPFSLLCCYEYGGYNTSLEQARVCNMPDTGTLNAICLFGTSRDRMKGEVLELHDKILRRFQAEGENDNLDEFLLSTEGIIAGCLCRLDGTDPTQEEIHQCEAMQPIPCVPGLYPKESLFTLECGPNPDSEVAIYIPLLLLLKPHPKMLLPVEHQRYGSFCPGAAFKDQNFHDDDLYYKDPFESGGPPVPITDCSGNPIVGGLTDSDDCRNWRIPTPNPDGTMTLPSVILKQNDYNRIDQEFTVGVPSGDSIFVCCFHYASDIFQRNPSQLTFCNAPSIQAMNHPEWCMAVAKHGIRNSTTYPHGEAAYQKLSDKLKVVVKYYSTKNNGNDLLDNPVEQEKWQKCMCSDLIPGLAMPEIENAVDICIKSIPTPCELQPVGMYDVYINCPAGWSQIKEIMYPKIFTMENGMWEGHARFVIAGAPPVDCPRQNDANWENDPNIDNASIQLFDCFLDGINFKDDCGIYNIPISDGKGAVTKPTKVVNPEYTLTSYNVPSPRWTAAHCCFHYAEYDEQWKVCNLPNSDSFRKKCDVSNRAPQRLAHEREFSRMAMVEDTNFGAVFKGNLVPTYDATTWESPVWKLFSECICENSNHPSCEAHYLPPCIAPKVAPSSIINVADTYTKCDHSWGISSDVPAFLSVPVVREFDKNSKLFKKLPRYKDGSGPADCPNDKTTDILRNIPSDMTISDCYGDELISPSTLPLDDCGNPYIRTPKRTNPSEWEYPTMHLIGLDLMPGMTGDAIFCCYLYPISNIEEVNVCNMPDAGAVNNNCRERNQTSWNVKNAMARFKETWRGTGSYDDLGQGLLDPIRLRWTKCICGGSEADCNSFFPPCFATTAPPPQPLTREWVDKMYFRCRTDPVFYPHNFMYYPKYFKYISDRYIQLRADGLVTRDCNQLPSSAEVTTGRESEVYDCEGRRYATGATPGYYTDDCLHPQLPSNLDVRTKITVSLSGGPGQVDVILCVNEYPRDPQSNSGDGRSVITAGQTDRANAVSYTMLFFSCSKPFNDQRRQQTSIQLQYLRTWRSLGSERKLVLEGTDYVVACVCQHLPQIKLFATEHGIPLDTGTCVTRIQKFT